ncbi:uncharacterized protein LOC134233435 [Saccostrea cucullata]|uniref:uncharacterized protein LOC134233435 n=1 Tax=Saccostrea cuccullata TaxID=36930 RepID=UPI002ED2F936
MTEMQWLKTCFRCSEGIRYICKNCQDSFCEKCVHEHVERLKHVQHSIVLYRYKNSKMDIPSCNKHPCYKLDTFCRRCLVPLCLKCWTYSKTHANHTFGYMTELIDIRKEEILFESNNLQSVIIPNLLNKSISLEKELTEAENEFDDALKNMEETKCFILEDINEVFTDLQKRTNKKKENVLSIFRNKAVHVNDAHSKALQVLHRNHSIVQLEEDNGLQKILRYKAHDETCFSTYGPHLDKVHNDLDVPIVVQGKSLNVVQEVQSGGFGSLVVDLQYSSTEDVSIPGGSGLLKKAFVIKTIQTKERNILRFVYYKSGIWICNHNSVISYADINRRSSENPDIQIACPKRPHDITVFNNEICYSCGSEGVFIVEIGESKLCLSIPEWLAEGLCATNKNELLVCVSNSWSQEIKIIRCDASRDKSKLKITQEIQFNGEQPLFQFGEYELFIAENKNEDICVSDTNADAVIVVDKFGKLRFKYQGEVMFDKILFRPDQIITDSLCNIIVTDYMNNCLHILDQNGLYLKCVDNCGLDFPIPIDIDEEGDLVVGNYLTGQIKVIRYRI